MKNLYLVLAFLAYFSVSVTCQKAGEVLENGIRIFPSEKLFLRFENGVLKYDLQKSLTDIAVRPSFIPLKDSSIFLPSKDGVNIYIYPLNPLVYEYRTKIDIETDSIDLKVIALQNEWKNTFTSLTSSKNKTNNSEAQSIKKHIEKVLYMLKNDKTQEEIIKSFNSLKSIDFAKQESTVNELSKIKIEIEKVKVYFDSIAGVIKILEGDIENIGTNNTDDSTGLQTIFQKYVLKNIVKEMSSVLSETRKKYEAINQAYLLVEKVKDEAMNNIDGLPWCIYIEEVDVIQGKISRYSITINKSNYSISPTAVISKVDSQKVVSKSIRFRKFQRFIPEISGGVLYTNFSYNTYGTAVDNVNNSQIVTLAKTSEIKNFKISSMINFTYFIPNSDIHPFYQIGLAINTDIPTVVTGFGLRSNINGINRFAVSTGIASTWIKDLTALHVGDKVSGTSDIEKDLTYQFIWPPRAYVGFQWNF